jgi:hypothetical protein
MTTTRTLSASTQAKIEAYAGVLRAERLLTRKQRALEVYPVADGELDEYMRITSEMDDDHERKLDMQRSRIG